MSGLDDKIINLKVITHLKQGQKLNSKYNVLAIEDGGWFSITSMSRWMRADSRSQTIKTLQNLYAEVIERIRTDQSQSDICDKLLRYLKDSRAGLENMKKTYCDDITTVASIELLIENINDLTGDLYDQVDSE